MLRAAGLVVSLCLPTAQLCKLRSPHPASVHAGIAPLYVSITAPREAHGAP